MVSRTLVDDGVAVVVVTCATVVTETVVLVKEVAGAAVVVVLVDLAIEGTVADSSVVGLPDPTAEVELNLCCLVDEVATSFASAAVSLSFLVLSSVPTPKSPTKQAAKTASALCRAYRARHKDCSRSTPGPETVVSEIAV